MATEEPIASRTPVSLDSRCPKGARSSAGERCLHTAEVTGSIPVAPTPRFRRSARPIRYLAAPLLVAHRLIPSNSERDGQPDLWRPRAEPNADALLLEQEGDGDRYGWVVRLVVIDQLVSM